MSWKNEIRRLTQDLEQATRQAEQAARQAEQEREEKERLLALIRKAGIDPTQLQP